MREKKEEDTENLSGGTGKDEIVLGGEEKRNAAMILRGPTEDIQYNTILHTEVVTKVKKRLWST